MSSKASIKIKTDLKVIALASINRLGYYQWYSSLDFRAKYENKTKQNNNKLSIEQQHIIKNSLSFDF